MNEIDNLTAPDDFQFPFPPYDIQKNFMTNLYNAIQNKKLGIFESPTGTGKSLSILCGAIRWLKDYNQHERKILQAKIANLENEKIKLDASTDDWMSLQSKQIEINRVLDTLKLQYNKIIQYDEKISSLKEKYYSEKKSQKKFWLQKENTDKDVDILSDSAQASEEDLIFDEDDLNKPEDLSDNENDDDLNKYTPIKIFICSRTHSQLSQLIGEIIKSPHSENVRTVSLASRQIYCVNPVVKRLKSMALINEKCLDMQKNKTAKKVDENGKTLKKRKTESCSCPYFKQQSIEYLSEIVLTNVLDIEDLIGAGNELQACPYYASRKACEDAEIILLPYNTLLHKATREANGINLKNNVLIIDEAHNLLESLAQMYNTELNYNQIFFALSQMQGYKKRFDTRFSAQNLLMINQLIFVINKLKQYLDKAGSKNDQLSTEIFTISKFMSVSEIDNHNMFKLTKFAKENKLAQKIHHYALKYPCEENVDKNSKNKSSVKGVRDFLASIKNNTTKPNKNEQIVNENNVEPSEKKTENIPVNPLLAVISFLESLTYDQEDGRILKVKNSDRNQWKYQFLLLNPSSKFKNIVQEARSVIVAGGTMKPIAEFKDRLFINCGAPPERIVQFSCDHVIPPQNILPIIMPKGPANENILFNFENRLKMGDVVSSVLRKSCEKIKGGIVVFFPSYQYESWFWEKVKGVNFGRSIFREPKDSSAVDTVLEKYSNCIKNSSGAMIFSVVGGKLSEGLNFSDDLGRCVIVIGLPYANIKAVDLKEKMLYLDRKEGYGSGHTFYENLCMKAVNQCIGRAVRHKDDFATVLLLDERYNRNNTKNALPEWIKRRIHARDRKSVV